MRVGFCNFCKIYYNLRIILSVAVTFSLKSKINKCRLCKLKSFNVLPSEKGTLFYTGSIRGAIAFGLAISIVTENESHKYFSS